MAQASSRHPWQAKAMRRQRLPVGASKIIDENKKRTYNGSIDREPHGQVRLVFMRDSNVRPDTLVLPSHALQSAPPAPCGVFFIWTAGNPLKSPESDEEIQENPSLFSWSGLVWLWFGLEEFGLGRRRRVARPARASLSEWAKVGAKAAKPVTQGKGQSPRRREAGFQMTEKSEGRR